MGLERLWSVKSARFWAIIDGVMSLQKQWSVPIFVIQWSLPLSVFIEMSFENI